MSNKISNEKKSHNLYKIGDRVFNFDYAYVMGVLNITPDSFSDGGKYLEKSEAVKHGLQMVSEGADIIDIGGESTRPNADIVTAEEEIKRVIPVIKGILAENDKIIISVDTTKASVAEEALKAGAKIINDISGLTFDSQLHNVIKKYNASVIVMHIKGDPKTMQNNPEYDNLMKEIYDFLFKQTSAALNAGINNIFIDPGIGFGKTIENNYEIVKRLGELNSLGFPIVFGCSRKSFIGKTLNLDPDERDTASAIINAIAIQNSAKIIRTHNVKYGVQTIKIMSKIN